MKMENLWEELTDMLIAILHNELLREIIDKTS